MQHTIGDINAMDTASFVAAFGDIAEHAPWVAEAAATLRPFDDRQAMMEAFAATVMTAPGDRQLALLNAHPDLAGRAAIAGELTEDSTAEQAGAGLDQLTADEFARFQDLNRRYRETFGFPFILAVKGATKQIILDAFATRVDNARDTEWETALRQVCRIIAFRLEDRVAG